MATSGTTTVANGVYTTLFEATVRGGSGTDGSPRGGVRISTSANATIKITPGYTDGFDLTSADGNFDYFPILSGFDRITKIEAAGDGGSADVTFKFLG